MTEAGCKPRESDSRVTHLMNILQSLSKSRRRGNRKLSQARTSNKDRDGNKKALDKIWQSVSPGRYREQRAEDKGKGAA